MYERGITAWQIEAGAPDAVLLMERAAHEDTGPRSPVRFGLPHGGLAVAVWELEANSAKLITVFPEEVVDVR